jgi:hypothetical protein
LCEGGIASKYKVLCRDRNCIGIISRETVIKLDLQFISYVLTHGVKHKLFRDCYVLRSAGNRIVCVDYKESGSR